MGLFDELKNTISNAATNAVKNTLNETTNEIKKDVENTINQATDEVKKDISDGVNQARNEAKEAIETEAKEKTGNTLFSGMQNYLDNAKDKVTTQDGKEAIETLQNLIGDAESAKKAATSVDNGNNNEWETKTQQDFQKLEEISNKYNNQN